jgi:hypothetical protein
MLERLIASNASEFAIRMNNARLVKAEQERQNFVAANASDGWGVIEHDEIAVGILEVSKE